MSVWKLKFAENFKYLICNNFQILLHFSTLRKPFEDAYAFFMSPYLAFSQLALAGGCICYTRERKE
jgi:hypothetical protein